MNESSYRHRADTSATTPMMAQYLEMKGEYPDCLLLFRMGDFYELFFEDAVTAAAALDITLTKRGQHRGLDVPMCGVPVHAVENYLARLVRQGFKVAVSEQMEDPKSNHRRTGNALVRRDVVRVITRGTLTEDELLNSKEHNYLAALADAGGDLALAWLDISTGTFRVQSVTAESLSTALASVMPGELLVSDRLLHRPDLGALFTSWNRALSPMPSTRFDSENARRRLKALYRVQTLVSFGTFSRAEISACGALVDYLELTQKGRLPRLSPPCRIGMEDVMQIDAATRRNLELVQALSGDRKGSLIGTIDRTVTGAGGRLLSARLAAPLTDQRAINGRLDMVQFLVDDDDLRLQIRARLRRCPEIERALSRLTLRRGGPRDLAAVRDALKVATALRELLSKDHLNPAPTGIVRATRMLGFHETLTERLARALGPDLPVIARDGGFIAAAYSPELDELRLFRDDNRRLIANLQSRYSKSTGIASLRIRHNNVLGYYVEVSPTHSPKIPSDTSEPFIHRQTLANAVRYTTAELADLEQKIATAGERALAIELQLFEDLIGEILGRIEEIATAAEAIAELDLSAALAELAKEGGWCRPVIEDTPAFSISSGKHAVVEAALAASQAGAFIANHCDLSPECRMWLITGPNMSGKSTFLRQNALIAVLGQIGSYVPAERAVIGIVDRLFSRVGAADDLARGHSTFMVEMVETATILNQATPKSLVILDEIGRGTATFDGLSLAWACIEHLHEVNCCRTLFASHFHELTMLVSKLGALSCHTVKVKEWQGSVVFLHEVVPGAADGSYGIHVAKLAGVPETVIMRAQQVLAMLEQGEQASALAHLADDLPLFTAARRESRLPERSMPCEIVQRLSDTNPDELTPKAALELLYELRRMVASRSGSAQEQG